MIITSIEEIRLYLPNHRLNDIQGLKGFIDSSERDFLADKLGIPLYNELLAKYADMPSDSLLPESESSWNAWHRLVRAAQPVVMFDALYRSADLNAISLNEAGINIASTDDYESAGEKLIEKFKSRCNVEAHRAVDRMLILLEDWALQAGVIPDEQGPEEPEEISIIRLWKKSKYYYRDASLFISTATQMQDYLDIYESREKFVSLLPQIRYIQQMLVAGEIGGTFVKYLVNSIQTDKATDSEKQLVEKICWWIAFAVESRSKMFSRQDAVQDAIRMRQAVIGFIKSHYEDFRENIGIDSPLYVSTDETSSAEALWQNNRPGQKLFVTPNINSKL